MTRAAAPAAPSVTATFTMPPATPAENSSVDETKPDFREYIFSLTPEQWKNHVIYLTRELPKTSINGLGGYLTKLQQPFDLEDIKNAYGGYEFSYILKEGNDICKKCRNASGRFKVEAPPKFDTTREAGSPAPTNGHKDSTSELLQQFVGVLRDELARSRENGNGSSTATEEAIKLLSSASDKAMQVLTKQIPQAGDPTAQLTALLAAAKQIAEMRAPTPAPAAGGLGELGTILVPVLKALAEKLITPTDPLEQLTKLAGLFDLLEKIRGKGGDGKADWKEALVQEGIPAAKELIGTIVETRNANIRVATEQRAAAEARARTAQTVSEIERTRAAANAAPPANAPRPPAAAPPPAAQPAPGAGPLRLTPIDAAAHAAPAEEVPGVTTPPTAANADEYTKGVKIRFVELLAEGEQMEMIVDWLELSLPKFVKQMQNFPEAQITAFMSTDPILAQVVAQPEWPTWLAAAREYLGSEEEEPEPVGAGARKPN